MTVLTDAEIEKIKGELEELEGFATEMPAASSAPAAPVAPTPPQDQLKTFVDTKKVKEDLVLNEAMISTAVQTQAALFAHYAMLASRAEHQHDAFKVKLDVLESTIDKELRDSALLSGEKVTEASLNKAIARDDRYVRMRKKVNDAKLIANICNDVKEAMKQRLFMILRVAKDADTERQGEIRILERDAVKERQQSLINSMTGASGSR